MRLLAITDGSVAALDSIQALSGIVPVDLHVLPRPIPNELKSAKVIVLAFDRFPTRSFEKLFDWLRDQGVGRRPAVLCLSKPDIARFSSSIRQITISIVSTPVNSEALLDAVEACDRQFGPSRRQNISATARTVQSLANTFNSLLGGNQTGSKAVLEKVASASTEVNTVIKTHGFEAWMDAVGVHQSYTARHCISVAGVAAQWAHTLRFSPTDLETFTQAALLHDIGKVTVPLSILDKPTELSEDERDVIRLHAAAGVAIVNENLSVDQTVKDVIYSHHEFLDGTGYPRGLTDKEIGNIVRCATIIDIYCALVDPPAFKKAVSPMRAYEVLRSMEGRIDMNFLAAFKCMLDEHVLVEKEAA